jgi:hypothetical protein
MYDLDKGGTKVVVIGRPGSGKTYAITSLLYQKRHIFPYALVCSGTEMATGYWSNHFPSVFVHEKLSPDLLQAFIDRQMEARKTLVNPWSVLLLDDCADDSRIMKGRHLNTLFKNGRHMAMLFILALQYANDIPPNIRANIDYTIIFSENRISDRKRLYDNYASSFPDFKTFCAVLDQVTTDHTALVIQNNTKSNNLEDIVFYWRAQPFDPQFKFGSQLYWQHAKQRSAVPLIDAGGGSASASAGPPPPAAAAGVDTGVDAGADYGGGGGGDDAYADDVDDDEDVWACQSKKL